MVTLPVRSRCLDLPQNLWSVSNEGRLDGGEIGLAVSNSFRRDVGRSEVNAEAQRRRDAEGSSPTPADSQSQSARCPRFPCGCLAPFSRSDSMHAHSERFDA